MKEPRIETILELEGKIEEMNNEFTGKLEQLHQWFAEQHLNILELELIDCDDDWDILGVLESVGTEGSVNEASSQGTRPAGIEGSEGPGDDEEGEDYSEDEYFQLLEKFEAILEERRKEQGR